MTAIEICDWALTWHHERGVIEGTVELGVTAAAGRMIVIARCGWKVGTVDTWLDPLGMRAAGDGPDVTLQCVADELSLPLADWARNNSALLVRMTREYLDQLELVERADDLLEEVAT